MPSSLNQSGQFTDCSSLTAVVHRKHLMADVIRHPDAQKLKELPELMVVQRSLTVLAPPHYNLHYFIHKISIFKDGIQAASACSPRLLPTACASERMYTHWNCVCGTFDYNIGLVMLHFELRASKC